MHVPVPILVAPYCMIRLPSEMEMGKEKLFPWLCISGMTDLAFTYSTYPSGYSIVIAMPKLK